LVKIKDLPTLTGTNNGYFVPAQNAAGVTRKIQAGSGGGLPPWTDVDGDDGPFAVGYGERLCVKLETADAVIVLPESIVAGTGEIWISVLKGDAGVSATVDPFDLNFRGQVAGEGLQITDQDYLVILRKIDSEWAVFNLPPTGMFAWIPLGGGFNP
jgi:hypothetical protein